MKLLLEGWLMLAYLAAATERIKLGTLVTGVTYRYPAVLVQQASSATAASTSGRRAARQTGSIADASTVLERASASTAAGSQGVFVVLLSVADSDSIERFGSEVIAA